MKIDGNNKRFHARRHAHDVEEGVAYGKNVQHSHMLMRLGYIGVPAICHHVLSTRPAAD